MSWIIDKIESVSKRINRKKMVVALIYDRNGYGECDDYETVIYKKHGREDFSDNGSSDSVTVVDSDGQTIILGSCDLDDNVKHVMLFKKNFQAKMDKLSSYKSPKNGKRHVGIELEFISQLSKHEIVGLMVDAGLENHVTVKKDGSVEPDDDHSFAHEIAILATEAEFESVIKKIAKLLKNNSTVNSSCGFHVHLDMRTRNVDNAYASLFEAQPVLYAMCPRSRLEGEYSELQSDFSTVTRDHSGERFVGVNQTAYMCHRTLEVRVHSGTLNAGKINSWVKMLIKVVDNAPVYDFEKVRLQRSLSAFKKQAKICGNLAKYIDERVRQFKSDHNGSQIALSA